MVVRALRVGVASAACVFSISVMSGVAQGADQADLTVINRIVDEGFNRSELPLTAAYLTDSIGGRLPNSPQMRAAERWTQEQYKAWGLKNVRTEGFEFGRGWSIDKSSVRMLKPRIAEYRAIPVAWTPATNGAINATIVIAPLNKVEDFARWKGKLRGQIVLVTQPDTGGEPAVAPFVRLGRDELSKLDTYSQPRVSMDAEVNKRLERNRFEAQRDEFLAAEGAVAWVRRSYREGGLVHGEGYMHRRNQSPKLPGFELAAEHYRQLARLAKVGPAPTLELISDVKYHDEDSKAYNVFADLPGRDAKAGYVMAGAHLDSWVASDGAQDNAAGSAVVMEAARILNKLGLKPKRTIRFALWNGEEQGLYGSFDYIERHLVSRAPLTSPVYAAMAPYATWNLRWPVKPGPDYDLLSAYFNLDNGSGKVRGIYAEGNIAATPILKTWLAPFASMGADSVVASPTGGTDHIGMQAVGIPGFQFVQDPLDYNSRIHHTSIDSYDHLRMEDLKQAAVIMASFLWMSADRDQPLPKKPLPTKPSQTDPFEYEIDTP
ncbi:M20/M25/M40 family metallo-hydrolase [Steroidobacter sp.]|uniref:M20/M25/M40 family metallo-hydrolase n=1 Tax=Steroidobacter sp. TaxID=1978227 RepID=UPI001A4FFAD5|nr:M20/M25/M40 family metallo-hydrolase [Steroidobacter sp.]MBL8265015.1 M20/M25/M40 family metallo-hydrolase [Steroidobacter sp.]